jgi:diguanylate cyclase (GGDEF)-like protein
MTPVRIPRWLALLLAACMLPAAAAPAVVPAPWPPVLGETLEAGLDDPQALLGPARARAAAAPAARRTWHWMLVARLEISLELDAAAEDSLRQARAALADAPDRDEAERWLRASEIRLASLGAGAPAQLPLLAALRSSLPPGPSVLRCELLDVEGWALNEIGSLDEAWRAAEAQDACGVETGWPFYRAQAALTQGQIAAADRGNPESRARALAHFQRAEAEVGPGPGRYLRSLVAYAAAISLAELGQPAEAMVYLQQALSISRSLGDQAGVAAALLEVAALDIERDRPARALAPLDEAEALLGDGALGDAARGVRVRILRLQALARLKHPALAARLAQAQAMDLDGQLPSIRQAMALGVAEALAALGRHAEAYEAMRHARRHEDQARQLARDTQVLQLQARYQTAQRDAELAALRHREEAARLTLQAQAATQRGLWAALAALALLLAGGGVLGWRSWRRRRELADLALRDELTGLPNRRAIEAYARAQLEQSLRLGLPFVLALLDLDHFKGVNDRHGHPAGDALLQALARVVPQVLRAPDRLGRWGGEEFLLVLPGTRAEEIGGVFARLLSAFAVADAPGLPSPHGVSFSLGGVQARPGDGFEALLAEADRRLYAAKAAGRATWR